MQNPNNKEAKARIKIDKLLEQAGWRFFDNEKGKANIELETKVKITPKDIDSLGNDFENTKNGFIDYLLLDDKDFPICVLEAKQESIAPLSAKEQARDYAKGKNCRFIILSNGISHYLWDLKQDNPEQITTFPSQESLQQRFDYKENITDLVDEKVDENYLAPKKILRDYQVEAIQALQQSAQKSNKRFLFEMATGTGKTTVAAAICKLFLKTGNAKRILF